MASSLRDYNSRPNRATGRNQQVMIGGHLVSSYVTRSMTSFRTTSSNENLPILS
jgi:hypothetical protein